MGMRVFQQKEPKECQAPIKLAKPFPTPELRAEMLWTSRFFSDFFVEIVFPRNHRYRYRLEMQRNELNYRYSPDINFHLPCVS